MLYIVITYAEILQQLRIFNRLFNRTTEKGSYKPGRYEEGLNHTLKDIFPTEPQLNQILN